MFSFICDAWDLIIEHRYIAVPVGLVAWAGLIIVTFRGER